MTPTHRDDCWCRHQAEEMKTWSDVEDLPKYLKKARAIDEKLQLAADTIEAFNVEETSFGWDLTVYPARLQILAAMKPFLSLYEISCEFHEKQEAWLHGPRSAIVPDNVEQVTIIQSQYYHVDSSHCYDLLISNN